MRRSGTLVDAAIIDSQPSTKNKSGKRGPRDDEYEERQRSVFWHEGSRRCR